jgi:hypothetical protein
MTHQSIFCIATSPFQANHIVDQLKVANFPEDQISALLADQSRQEKSSSGMAPTLKEGSISGGNWGWIARIGALAIPGAGIFIAAGPIISAMSGTSIGVTQGGICGGLIVMGVPEIEAKCYEGRILKGSILLSVLTESPDDSYRVKHIFDQAEAQDIRTTGRVIKVAEKSFDQSQRRELAYAV